MLRLQLIILTFFCHQFVWGQSTFEKADSIPKNNTIVTIDGKDFFVHIVERGQTLYAIAKRYNVDVKDIVSENPQTAIAINIGDRIKIPVNNVELNEKGEVAEVNGNYIIHEVKKGETLYGIASEFDLKPKDLIVENPEVKNGLSVGQQLKIPVNLIKKVKAEYHLPAVEDQYLIHHVKKGETLYSLSKLYNIRIDSLIGVNNGLLGGLKVDEIIKIPVLRKRYNVQEIDSILDPKEFEFDSSSLKEKYNIVLMLPLFIEANDTIEEEENEEDKEGIILGKSKIPLDLYAGIRLALEQVSEKGFNASLQVFDTENNLEKIKSFLESGKLDNTDLIIGPLYPAAFTYVADFAKVKRIPIVSPIAKTNKVLLSNPYACKILTSRSIQSKEIANYVYENYKTDNIILITDQDNEEPYDNIFMETYKSKLTETRDTTIFYPPKVIQWHDNGEAQLKTVLLDSSLGYTNVIVVPSVNQHFVVRVLPSIYEYRQNHDLIVFGLDKWLQFDNIQIEFFNRLNIHISTSTVLNYDDPGNELFLHQYRRRYQTEPNEFDFLGYHMGMYFFDALHQFGTQFLDALPHYEYKSAFTSFNFFKTGELNGYENKHVNLLNFEDYQLKIIR